MKASSLGPGSPRQSSWFTDVFRGRRTRFQLTPLMDLLLIIVFAQFLDVRETSREQTESLRTEQALLDSQRREWLAQRDQARADRDMAIATRESMAGQVDRAIELLRSFFALDAADVSSLGDSNEPSAADDRAAAIQTAGELSRADPASLIRFLISHGELLKRAEVWTLHAGDGGEIELIANNRKQSFRLESPTQTARTSEVADRLFAAHKQLPQPKGLVIVLVSYSPRSTAGVYQPLVDAIPATLERLRADRPGTRFEYTVLGTTPPPQLADPKPSIPTSP